MVRVGPEPIDSGALLGRFCADRTTIGAVASFTGLARATAGDASVIALELQHYPRFTERAIEQAVRDASARFALQDVLVVHRVGRIVPGEAIVFVAAAAEHRRAAFQAADRLMDWLKVEAPFWKREHRPDGSHWIEPRGQDHQDAARWAAPPETRA